MVSTRELKGVTEVAYFEVETVRVDDIVIYNLNVETGVLGQILDEFPQLRSADAVCTINSQRALDLDAPHDPLKSFCKLFVISLLSRLSILVLRSESVLAPDDVMQLGSGHILHIDELGLRGSECSTEDADESRTGCTSIPGENNTSRVLHADIDLLNQFVVNVTNVFQRSIREFCSVCFPFSLVKRRVSIRGISSCRRGGLLPTFHPILYQYVSKFQLS
jgi:hypothetical protein